MGSHQFEYIKSLVESLNPSQLKLLKGKINEKLGETEVEETKVVLSRQEMDMISELFTTH